MKILTMSDLHLECGNPLEVPAKLKLDSYDIVILAGDILCPGERGVQWARQPSTFAGKPVVMVAGNHEFYGRLMPAESARMREAATGSNVHFLERDAVVIDGVRFLGCVLWSDFQLPIRQAGGGSDVDIARAMREANRRMNDFRQIEVLSPVLRQHRHREQPRLMQAADSLALHWIDRDWLRRQLAEPFDGPTVVVTHHAPAIGSVADRYATDWLTPAFVTDLPDDFFQVPVLWVHGHTHSPFDYVRGNCRVVSNPRGYLLRDGSFENHRFNAGLVIEITGSAGTCS